MNYVCNRNKLPTFVRGMGLTGNWLEVGVQAGEYARTLQWFGEPKRLYLVDAWRHYPSGYADPANVDDTAHIRNMAQVAGFFSGLKYGPVIIRAESVPAAEMFKDEFFDFIYIDANHTYDGVSDDLRAWYPKLKTGGIFSGHDYVNMYDGDVVFEVKKAVDQFAVEQAKTVSITTCTWPSWFFQK